MTEYAWPAVLRPSRLSFYLQHNTLRFVSPVRRSPGTTKSQPGNSASRIARLKLAASLFDLVMTMGAVDPSISREPM